MTLPDDGSQRVSARWTSAFLAMLDGMPTTRTDLITLGHLSYVLAAKAPKGHAASVHGILDLLVVALLGDEPYRLALAARLPLFAEADERPRLLASRDAEGEREFELRNLALMLESPGDWLRASSYLMVHRRGAAMAFGLETGVLGSSAALASPMIRHLLI